jgi:hypothetical protein
LEAATAVLQENITLDKLAREAATATTELKTATAVATSKNYQAKQELN